MKALVFSPPPPFLTPNLTTFPTTPSLHLIPSLTFPSFKLNSNRFPTPPRPDFKVRADDGDADGGGDDYDMDEEEAEEVDNKKDYDVEYEPLASAMAAADGGGDEDIAVVQSKSFVSTQGWDSETIVNYRINEDEFHKLSLLDCDFFIRKPADPDNDVYDFREMYVTPPDTDIYSIPKVLAPMPQKAIQKQHLVMERIHRLRQKASDTASQVGSLQTELGRAKASFDRASTENNRLLGQLSEAEKKRDELQAELNALKESREKDCEDANNVGFKEAEDNYKKQVFATQDIYFKAGWKEACSKLGQGPETDVFAATPKAFLPVYLVPYANDVFTALQAEAEEELARETAADTGEGSSPEQNVQNEPGDQERAPPVNIEDDYDNLSPLA